MDPNQNQSQRVITPCVVDLEDIRLGSGPGTRGSTCNICMEKIKATDDSATHTGCENTFHSSCLDEWTDSNYAQSRWTTCPMCRAPLSQEDKWEFESNSSDDFYDDPPSPVPAFSDRSVSLMTQEMEMYDYDMRLHAERGSGFPTPAFLHRFRHQYRQAVDWIGDYFIRLSQAQDYTPDQATLHVVQFFLLQSAGLVSAASPSIEAELLPGELVTDLEIIDRSGQRRPRPTMVDFFDSQPERACDWLRRRMNRIQLHLDLDVVKMRDTRKAFLRSVFREIRARRRARLVAA